jgi:hypothetical protein
MTRRRVLLLGSVAVVAALVVAAWIAWPCASSITFENANRIHHGMTLQEVEAILGGPARDDTGGVNNGVEYGVTELVIGDGYREWIGPEYGILIAFRSDRAGQIWIGNTRRQTFSPVDRLRRWLGL